MVLRITCTHCQTVLGAPESVIGKRVKCTKCGNVFTAESPESVPPPPTACAPPPLPKPKRDAEEPRPSRRSTERVDDEPSPRSERVGGRRDPGEYRRSRNYDRYDDDADSDIDDDDRPRSRRGRGKKKSRVLLYVLLGLGATFVLCGGGGGVAIYFALSEGTPRDYT